MWGQMSEQAVVTLHEVFRKAALTWLKYFADGIDAVIRLSSQCFVVVNELMVRKSFSYFCAFLLCFRQNRFMFIC